MNLLNSDDLSERDIAEIFRIADRLSQNGRGLRLPTHATVAMLFQKPSTRTRISFAAAIAQLGGEPIYVDADKSQLSRGETVADTAKMLGSYCNIIVARLNKHEDIKELAVNSGVPVINALTDLEHPTQALTDIYTVRAHTKELSKARLCFIGDIAANTANSLMITAAKCGVHVSLVGPHGYRPNPVMLNKARSYGSVDVYDDIERGLSGCDFVYTDTFVSMGQEEEAEARKRRFAPYQLNDRTLSMAKPGALVMHCLPAHRGEEITTDVIDGKQSIVWEQARNKLLIAKAVLVYISQHSKD